MTVTTILWLVVSPLLAANLVWFYLTASAWTQQRDRQSLVLMGVQIGITIILGSIPVIRAYTEDRQLKAARKRQSRSKRVAWQADKLDNLSE
jgi:hypothetical protein